MTISESGLKKIRVGAEGGRPLPGWWQLLSLGLNPHTNCKDCYSTKSSNDN